MNFAPFKGLTYQGRFKERQQDPMECDCHLGELEYPESEFQEELGMTPTMAFVLAALIGFGSVSMVALICAVLP